MILRPGIVFLFAWSLHVDYARSSCPSGAQTLDPKGRCCVFPFVYQGIYYGACTRVGYLGFNGPWCSFDLVFKGDYGLCVSPCSPNPCKNGGSCSIKDANTYVCNCPERHGGRNCEKEIPCPPGKQTLDPKGRCCVFPFVYNQIYYGACTRVGYLGFNGPWCSFDPVFKGDYALCVSPCSPNPCKNGGSCSAPDDKTYVCNCPERYGGRNCETKLPCPLGRRTKDPRDRCCVFPFVYNQIYYGACTRVGWMGASGPWCSFDRDFKGDYALCVSPCEPNPCKNGGTCTANEYYSNYICNCLDQFGGRDCETSACDSSPCKNGASCSPVKQGYTCQPCPSGWKGKDCDEDIDECLSQNPCQNGATCVNSPGNYSCNCAAGYKGNDCQYDIDECLRQNPCKNGGTCVNSFGNYSCNCAAGYKGNHCQDDIDECLSQNPCQNGGTCVNSFGNYSCNCAAGYKGNNCQDVSYWKAEGCYMESKNLKKRLLQSKFFSVKNVDKKNPDIERIYDQCRKKAEVKGYRMFGVRGFRNCVTSMSGNVADFSRYGKSLDCKQNGLGHGIGFGKRGSSNFVYTR